MAKASDPYAKARASSLPGGDCSADVPPSFQGALSEAAWAEADLALAQALALLDECDTAPDEAARAEAMDWLRQALVRAGRKRGFVRTGSLGAEAPYDPLRHDLIAPGKPRTVRIAARGVSRGEAELVKPRVTGTRKRR